jgi:hypothetical protein
MLPLVDSNKRCKRISFSRDTLGPKLLEEIAIALLVASLILCAVITANPKSKTDIHKNE